MAGDKKIGSSFGIILSSSVNIFSFGVKLKGEGSGSIVLTLNVNDEENGGLMLELRSGVCEGLMLERGARGK